MGLTAIVGNADICDRSRGRAAFKGVLVIGQIGISDSEIALKGIADRVKATVSVCGNVLFLAVPFKYYRNDTAFPRQRRLYPIAFG